MSGLMLHAGAQSATREQVAAVVTPAPTASHFPIPHELLIATVIDALGAYGLTVTSEAYGLFSEGRRMFGVLELANGQAHSDYALTLGIRNAHDKSMAAAGAIGSRVFVCDNLAFSGEVTFARKHTTNIVAALPGLTNKAIGNLIALRGWQDQRIAAYKEFQFDAAKDVHDFIIRALMAGVIPTAKVDDVLREWNTPTHEEFAPRTAWSLFNAFTEALKGAPSLLTARTTRLHAMVDQQVGLAAVARVIGDDPHGADGDADYEIIAENN